MSESTIPDLQIHINGSQHIFLLSKKILSKYSTKLRKLIKQQQQNLTTTPPHDHNLIENSFIELTNFPGGPEAFELITRFCYNNAQIQITVSNVSLLHCSALFLDMSETRHSRNNLIHQTETFLQGIYYWSWHDLLSSLHNCEPFFAHAKSSGLIDNLISSLLAKIAQKSDLNFISTSSSSSSSSPDQTCSPSIARAAWWFRDMTILGPEIIQEFLKAIGSYKNDNSNLLLTRFLLHYLKTALHSKTLGPGNEYGGVADTAVNGVLSIGKSAFSCRGIFWVLRIVSGFGISKESREGLERLIGGMLDNATLDDLLVTGMGKGLGVYDVNLVVRLIGLFVRYNNSSSHDDDKLCLERIRKVGELIDKYLGEIGPDPNLKISKFLKVAESLPDCARDCFDQVYRAVEIYLQSHPCLPLEERSRLCRCINYEKLSLEACKDLAKNPLIPPRIAVQALAAQHSKVMQMSGGDDEYDVNDGSSSSSNNKDYQMVLYEKEDNKLERASSGKDIKVNLERMQWRVVELEKVCKQMRGEVLRMVKLAPQHNRTGSSPRMC